MPSPLTRGELDSMPCGTCGSHRACNHGMFISGMCHMGKPVEAIYKDGIIRIKCSVCKKLVVEIAVEP